MTLLQKSQSCARKSSLGKKVNHRTKLDPRDPHGERKEPALAGCPLNSMCTLWRVHTQTHMSAKSVNGIIFKTGSFFCVVELGMESRALKILSKHSTEPHPRGT